MTPIKAKPFEKWLHEDVENVFGLKRLKTHPILEKFDQISFEGDPNLKETIEKYRQTLHDYVDTWNEDELKFLFLSRFIGLVEYQSQHYKVFTQRPMKVFFDDKKQVASGRVEFLVATGKQTPKKPFFFLHEYKPTKGFDNDPLGQLLMALLAAQQQNLDEKPIYGCYVIGRFWFFVVLDQFDYCVSEPYVASQADIFRIFAILQEIKKEIEARFA